MPGRCIPVAGLRELVRYACLAPSSHNTQCWRFALAERSVAILPDFARRCPVVDPDDQHLFVSLGCAAENLLLAAAARGLRGEARYEAAPQEALAVGRALQRFALQATALGLRTAHLNQPVEVAALRPDFARAIGVAGARPDLVIHFGRGPELPRSLRRPLEAVLLPPA